MLRTKESSSTQSHTHRKTSKRDEDRRARHRSRSHSRDRYRRKHSSRERDDDRRQWRRSHSHSRSRSRSPRARDSGRRGRWDQERPSQPVTSQIYNGKVTSIMQFGCFVQLEGGCYLEFALNLILLKICKGSEVSTRAWYTFLSSERKGE